METIFTAFLDLLRVKHTKIYSDKYLLSTVLSIVIYFATDIP